MVTTYHLPEGMTAAEVAADHVTIPRELAERVKDALTPQEWSPGCQERIAEALADLKAITDPPPEFDPGAIEALTAAIFSVGSWWLSHERAEKVLTAARNAGWEMVRAEELGALREFTALLFEGEEPELTDDELAYGIYFSDHLTDAQFYVPLSSAQRDAIRKAKAAQR